MNENDQKLFDEIKQGVTNDVIEELKSNQVLRKKLFGGDNAETENNNDLPKFAKSAEYLKAINGRDVARAKELAGYKKGMSEGVNADGGYIVPVEFSDEIIRVANDYGVVRQNARRMPMKHQVQNVPTAQGVTVNRVAEGVTIGASKPTISRTVLTAKKLVALIPVSNELLEDADPDVIQLLALLAAEGFAGKEDSWGLAGLASGEGIFQNSSITGVTMGTGNTAFKNATFDNLIAMQNQLKSKALARAKWVMHSTVLNDLRAVKDSYGRYLLGEPGAGLPPTIWNLPVVTSDAMPADSASAVSTQFMALANFDYMLFGDRKQMTMEISRDASVIDTDGSTTINAFAQDMSIVKFTERIDIELVEPTKAFTWLKTAAS